MLARALVIAILAVSTAARAQDEFEIQVYESEIAQPGQGGFELHVNSGSARVTHLTLEPHMGLASWIEAGAYVQTAIRPDGGFDYAGVKLRSKLRVPRRLGGVVGLAINFEVSAVPKSYEANRAGSELRPVIDVRWRRLYASVNPIVGIDLDGALVGRPQFEPCAKIAVSIWRPIEIGIEYYGALGPIGDFSTATEQVHRLFGVIDAEWGRFALNAGVGYGLAAGERWIGKVIVGADL